jgi:hypothetical protein
VRHRRAAPPSGSVAAPAVIAAVTLVAGVLAVPHAEQPGPEMTRWVAATNSLADEVIPAVRGRGTVLVEWKGVLSDTPGVGSGLLVQLREAGVPFVLSDQSVIRQLGNYRTYDGGNADLRLTVVNSADDETVRTPRGTRLIARSSVLTPAQRDEVERLRVELRDAIAAAGGLPLLDLHPPVVDEIHVPGIEEEIYGRIAAVAALGDDPDELVDSYELTSLLGLLDWGYTDVDDVIDPEAIPTDDLMRYGRLRGWLNKPTMTVYLEELPDR